MDDARRKILERRSRFVAAAISTIAIGCERPPPQPCLSPIAPDDIGAGPADATDASAAQDDATTVPQPCLSPQVCLSPVPMDPPDAGAQPTPDAGKPDAKPHPCLKIAPPKDAGPKVCLDFAQ